MIMGCDSIYDNIDSWAGDSRLRIRGESQRQSADLYGGRRRSASEQRLAELEAEAKRLRRIAELEAELKQLRQA